MFGLEQEFRFIRPLGRGAEGVVRLAEDLRRDRLLVAWKLLAGTETRLPEEFQLLQRVQHPSINRVLETGLLPEGGQWFTSPYFPGLPLHRLPAPLDPTLLEGICHRACLALTALNEAGFRHGDLKPAHFLWSGPDPLRLELIDLGHAAPLEGTRAKAVGTPPYAAPELWGENPAPTRNTDLYALAMCALEVLRGSPVIGENDLAAWRRWHEEGDREAAFSLIASEVSGGFVDALRVCLSPDPADRPRDAAALAHRITPWPNLASPEPAREAEQKRLRGRREWLHEASRALFSEDAGAAALVLSGATGSGCSRLLRALAGRVRAEGGISIEATAEAAFYDRIRSALSLEAPHRVLFIDDVPHSQIGAIVAGWRRARALPRSPACRLVIALTPEGHAHAAEVAHKLASVATPVSVLPVPGLDLDAFRRLAHDLGVPGEQVESLWREGGGRPASLLPSGETEGPEPTTDPPPLDHPLDLWLSEIPAPVPAEVLTRALEIDGDELWRRLAAAGAGAPSVIGESAGLQRETDAEGISGLAPAGRTLMRRVLPRPTPRSADPGEALLPLAEAWEERDGETGRWCALYLRARAGRSIDEHAWRAAIDRAFRHDDMSTVFALVEVAPDREEAIWIEREARARAGEADRVRGDLPSSPTGLTPERARITATILEGTDGPAAALPFALARVEACRTDRDSAPRQSTSRNSAPSNRAENDPVDLAAARIAAARLALEAGDGETADRLLAAPIEEATLAPADLFELGNLRMRRGALPEAERAVRQALAMARGGHHPQVVIGALSTLSGLARIAGDGESAARHIARAIRYARLARLEERKAGLAINQGAILYSLRRSDAALEAYRRARRFLASFPDPTLEGHALLGTGTVLRDRGDLFPALIALRRALRHARASSAAPVLASALGNLGDIELLVGDPIASRDHRHELLALAEGIGAPALVRQARIACAASLLVTGEIEEADALLRELSETEASGGPRLDAWEHRVRADRAALAADTHATLHWSARALRDALRSGRSYTAAHAVRLLAAAVARRGDPPRALRLIDRGLELSRRDPCPPLSRIPLEIERARYTPTFGREEQARAIAVAREAQRLGLTEDFLTIGRMLGKALPDDLADLHFDRSRRLARRYGEAGARRLPERRGWIVRAGEPRKASAADETRSPEPPPLEAKAGRGSAPRETVPLESHSLAETTSLDAPSTRGEAPAGTKSQDHSPAASTPHPIVSPRAPGSAPRPLPALGAILDEWCAAWDALGGRALVRPARAWRIVEESGEIAEWLAADRTPPEHPDLPGGEIPQLWTEVGPEGWTAWITWPGRPDRAVVFRGNRAAGDMRAPELPAGLDPTELGHALALQHHRRRAEIAESRLERLREEVRTLRARAQDARVDLETQGLSDRLDADPAHSVTRSLQHAAEVGPSSNPWIAHVPTMEELTLQADRWHASTLPILVSGESGTGKSALLDRFARNATPPVITENCAALPEALLEAELFGFVPGAFTGADRTHPGLLARAAGGTLILDQLDELSPSLQAKLLRALDSGRYRPLGADEERTVNCRFVATLREAPQELVANGRLRAELYYRLQGIEVALPPLRERPQEIAPLLEAYLRHGGRDADRPPPAIEPKALELLEHARWPGNVRELVNLTQRWWIEGRRRISADDVREALSGPEVKEDPTAPPPVDAWHGEDWRTETERFHRALLTEALARFAGNQTHTAQALGISRRHLQNLLNKLGFRGE